MRNAYEASRIDSFLDAILVFARDAQIYLLSLAARQISAETYSRAREGFATYAAGIEQGLSPGRAFIVGEDLHACRHLFRFRVKSLHERGAARDLLREKGLEPILDAALDAEYPQAMGALLQNCVGIRRSRRSLEPYLK